MRTGNPTLNERTFLNRTADAAGGAMSVQGTVFKTFTLLGLLLITAGWTWHMAFEAGAPNMPSAVGPWIAGGLIGGLVFALVTAFVPRWAAVTAPAYALCEGLFIGGLSAIMEARFPNIVLPAVGLTLGTLAAMLGVYTTGLVRVTQKFRMAVFAATGAIALVYLVSIVLSFFGMTVPYIHEGGAVGILFSLFVVGVAAMNLVLDFDIIDRGAAQGAPRYMEWYAAFGLIVTLVWLYIEFLRLLSKLRRD